MEGRTILHSSAQEVLLFKPNVRYFLPLDLDVQYSWCACIEDPAVIDTCKKKLPPPSSNQHPPLFQTAHPRTH